MLLPQPTYPEASVLGAGFPTSSGNSLSKDCIYHAARTCLHNFPSKDFLKQMLPFHEQSLWMLFHKEQIVLFLTMSFGEQNPIPLVFPLELLAISISVCLPFMFSFIFSLPKNLFLYLLYIFILTILINANVVSHSGYSYC